MNLMLRKQEVQGLQEFHFVVIINDEHRKSEFNL